MDIELGVKAQVAARRSAHPWLEGDHLALGPGPQLFTDWRYVLPGEIGVIGPYWAEPDGTPIPLRLWDDVDRQDRPVRARFVPSDVPSGIRIVATTAQREGPLPAGAPPGRRIIYRDGLYQTWFDRGTGEAIRPLWYAESSDGYEYGGERECQFDWSAAPEAAGHERTEIFFDPSAPVEESYKMFFRCGVPTKGEARQQILEHFARERPDDIHPLGGDFRYLSGMWGATSPDGVYWTVLPGPLVIHYSDTTNVVYYDERLRRYVWYARCSAYGRRCIGRAETEDFRRWPLPDLLVWPGLHHHPADDWYTNSKTLYPGTIDQHLMFPALYHHMDDTSELRLFSSPDGIVWSEVPGPPSVPSGDAGAWDEGCVFGGTDLIPLGTDRVALPYGGYRFPHKYPRNPHTFRHDRGYAVWPAERLAALEAEQDGSFTALPMVASGRRVRLNAAVKAAGHILVEVADHKGRALPGHTFDDAVPILGDSPHHRVAWRGGDRIQLEEKRSFMLRLRLRCAKLFAFEVEQ
ncbi:MAG: hypothetical protein F4Z30_07865 [Gemmatimonadetes bacterium]|nr:hypothetical protein [Gemmatimonadota bacterium]